MRAGSEPSRREKYEEQFPLFKLFAENATGIETQALELEREIKIWLALGSPEVMKVLPWVSVMVTLQVMTRDEPVPVSVWVTCILSPAA